MKSAEVEALQRSISRPAYLHLGSKRGKQYFVRQVRRVHGLDVVASMTRDPVFVVL